ncbi:hypothetical protein Dsin_001754 [Dipteronia sinensis]|uniref:Uncharacterized protein n=1 Tax=Dipteronia sinensis TaxID=43782 RepID=A0AAE0B4K2_9ROSI|nr:hypothetical protein Dsin_001754 [Dipteronia sinensis]
MSEEIRMLETGSWASSSELNMEGRESKGRNNNRYHQGRSKSRGKSKTKGHQGNNSD